MQHIIQQKQRFFSLLFLVTAFNLSAMEQQTRAIACFTCSAVRLLSPMREHSDVSDYEKLVEAGNWRVGKWIYPPCQNCPQRLCRIKTETFISKYLKEDLSPKVKSITKWPIEYKKMYETLTVEMLDADSLHHDILELYKHSCDLSEVDTDQFFMDYCTSPIGSADKNTIKQLNAGNYSVKVSGSMFALIKADGKPVAAVLLDACNNWLGFKSFWYKDAHPLQNKPVMVKMCWFKVFQLAQQLNYPYVQLSIFDPTNSRLMYKLNYSEMLEVNANNDGNWVPMNRLMDLIIDSKGNRVPKSLECYFEKIKHACKVQ